MKVFVADIGGTNSRFAIFDTEKRDISHYLARKNEDFSDFNTLLVSVLDDVKDATPHRITHAGFGVACQINQGRGRLNKRPEFEFETQKIEQLLKHRFGTTVPLALFNDFEALAYALPHLNAADTEVLFDVPVQNKGPYVALGPGTGLGVSTLVCPPKQPAFAIAGEGGHISLPLRSHYEMEVAQALRHLLKINWPDADDVISGLGLEALYQAVLLVNGRKPDRKLAENITRLAQDDPDCYEANATRLCARWLLRLVGDLAVLTRPHGGIYLAGGMCDHILKPLSAEEIRSEFRANGHFEFLGVDIPLFLLKSMTAALTGAGYATCIRHKFSMGEVRGIA